MCLNGQFQQALGQGINDFAEMRQAKREAAEQEVEERAARERAYAEVRARLRAAGERTSQILQHQLLPQLEAPALPDFRNSQATSSVRAIGKHGSSPLDQAFRRTGA